MPDLRLIVITDRALAHPNDPIDVVRVALEAGAPAVQLRDKHAFAAQLLQHADTLRALTREHHALLFINDRLDVAIAAGADGVHLGPHDMPVAAARRIAPPGFLIGFSTDDPDLAKAAERDGASYIGCGAVFGTTSKTSLEGEQIGTGHLDLVARSVRIPVVAIGGITTSNVHQVATTTRARGVAVIGALMASPDPAQSTRSLLAAFATH